MARSCGIREMGGADQGVGLSLPGRTPCPRLFPGATSAPQGAPVFRPHPGGCWSEALLLPDRQRDGAGLRLWVGCGCEVPYCYPGSHGGGWLLPGRGKGVGRAGCGLPQRQQCPPGCHGHRRWSRQSSPRGAQGTWRWSFAVTRAVSIPENRPTAAPCCRSCDLAPSAKGAGGRREQPDGHHDTQAGLCLPQWALAFGALSRITLLWVM